MKLAARYPFTVLLFAGASSLLPLNGAEEPVQTQFYSVEVLRPYPAKDAGDNALKEQNFDDAASFYRDYRKEAELNHDLPAIREACECEINALILGARVSQAEDLLKQYEKMANRNSGLAIELWKADLLLLKGEPAKAEKTLKKVLPKIPLQDPMRTRATVMLAAAYDLQKKYRDAVPIYQELYQQDPNTDFGRRIAERLICSLTASGDLEQAGKVIVSLPAGKNERDLEAHHFLNIYLTLKNGIALPEFGKTETVHTAKQDDFLFLIISLIADEYTAKKEFRSAINAYNLAYSYARTPAEAFAALSRMTVVLEKMQQKQEAAGLAMTQLDLFKHNSTDPKLKKFVARLFFDTGKQTEALALYEQIFLNDHKEDCAGIFAYLLKNKQYENAEAIVRLYYRNSPDSAQALIFLASVAEAKGDKRSAADLYQKAYLKGDLPAAFRALHHLTDLEDYSAVIQLADTIIKSRPGNAQACYFRGNANEAQGNNEAAIRDFLACEQNGFYKPAEALFKAAAIYYRSGNFSRARQLFNSLFQNEKYREFAPRAAYWVILSSYNMDDSVHAEKVTFQLAEKFPGFDYSAMAMLMLADFYIKSDLPEKADNLLKKITTLKAFPNIQARALYQQALLAYKKNDFVTAERTLQMLQEKFAKNAPLADVYYLTGDVRRAQSKFKEAADAYAEAARLKPDSRMAQAANGSRGDCIFAIATASEDQAALENALQIYNDLLNTRKLLPEFRIMTMYKAGRCLQLLGRQQEAFARFRSVFSAVSGQQAAEDPVRNFWILKAV
ncbi:MAG: tetratricopeptide repeat protein, partial [Lentisphaeria bacterium]|nr:tetratricopeptide repeat protein [Lentisphaeria bacterium]